MKAKAPPPRSSPAPTRRESETVAPRAVHEVIARPGEPLAPSARANYERAHGFSLSNVRIHRGDLAEKSAAMVGARGYTVGNHVVLGRGATTQTLDHELTHTVQQRVAPARATLPIVPAGAPSEREADDIARGATPTITQQPLAVARESGPWLFAWYGPEGVELLLDTPATTENATQRFAMLRLAILTLTTPQAIAMKVRLSNRKTHIGERFSRLHSSSQKTILKLLDMLSLPKAATPSSTTNATTTTTASAEDQLADKIDNDEAWGTWTGGGGSMDSLFEMDQNTPESERPFYSSTEFRTWYLQGYRGIARLSDPAGAMEFLAAGLITDLTARNAFLERYKFSTSGSDGSSALDAARASGDVDASAAAIGAMGSGRQRDVAVASGDYSSTTFAEKAKGRDTEKGSYVITFERWLLDGVEVTTKEWEAAKPIMDADAPHRWQWLEVDESKGFKRVEKYGFGEVEVPNQADGAVWSRDYVNANEQALVRETWFHVDPDDVTRGRRMLRTQWAQVGPSVGIDDGLGHVGADVYVGGMIEGAPVRVAGIKSTRRVQNQPRGIDEVEMPTGGRGKGKGKTPPADEADVSSGKGTSGGKTGTTNTTSDEPDTETPGKSSSNDVDGAPDGKAATSTAVDPVDVKPARPSGASTRKKGAVLFLGKWVKASVATAKRYWWKNPRMPKGNFIDANFDNGTIEVEVKASGKDDSIKRSGTDLLDDAFAHFGPENIKQFDGKWVRNSSFRRNYDEYTSNRAKDMSEKEAAWNTWTGRRLEERGFKNVEVRSNDDGSIIYPVFTK